MPYDFDVLVIGSGAGGGTFAHACARAGKRVLLVERGQRHTQNGQAHDERVTLIDKQPYSDLTVHVNGLPRRLYAGGGLGGGTALYGAALLRPSPEDFHPGRYYAERLPRTIWDWPISYDALELYYTEAERLYGVAGCGDDDLGPLGKPRHGYPGQPLPVEPINRRLMAANAAHGLKPFRLPLAIDARSCLQCSACAGFVCPTGARRSSAHLLDGVQVMTNVEAERFSLDGAGRVDGVRVRDRGTGQTAVYRAQRYVLAAGAIGSPLLLLRSGFDGPLIGRHYMYHLSPIVAGVFARRTGGDEAFVKQVGFTDYYLGTKAYPHKLGLVSSLPVPGPLMLAKAAGPRLPRGVVPFLRRRLLPFAGIVEDLPNPDNRVSLGKDGAAELRHAFGPYDVERGRWLAGSIKQILKRAGALFCLGRTSLSEEHVAHQCGTLRFGARPTDAVADADCRLFGQPNLFVVDGSVFPTSLGVGPALTIIANALRVARVVAGEVYDEMRKRFLRTKLEEWSQAWKIHGGPVNLCVAALGVRLARVPIPSRRLRLLVYRTMYGKKYAALDESEFERPMWAYPSVNALFTRGVREECRPIAADPDQFLCPCDGTVQEVGKFDRDRLITVKGVEYTLDSLLPRIDTGRLRNGRFAILFLSPADCHRIFSPQDGRIEEVVHVPGYRLLVHPPFQRNEYPVFALNERVIFRYATPLGACVLVMVAGWGVGNITLRFDEAFRPRAARITRKAYTPAVDVMKGDWIATFELGSTAILITEPGADVTTHVKRDEKVKYGQPLFSYRRLD